MPIAISSSDIFHVSTKKSNRRGSDNGLGLLKDRKQDTTQRKRRSDCFQSFATWKTAKMCAIKTLREFLKKKSRILAFRAFLQKEFSEENLDFWIEVEAYKKQKSNKQQKLADVIFEKYIEVDSPREINIDAATRKTTKNKMDPPVPTTFDEAQDRVFTMMERDSFRRFLAKEWNLPSEEKQKSSNKKLKQNNAKPTLKKRLSKRFSSDSDDSSNSDKSSSETPLHLNFLLFGNTQERRRRMFTV